MNKIISFSGKLPDILYPRRCPLCDRILGADEPYICRKCGGSVKFIKSRTCVKCGRVLKSRFEDVCAECAADSSLFDEGFAPFSYSGAVRESIIRYKYSGRAGYAVFYAKCIYEYGMERIKRWNASALVPVPVHPSRLCSRGYNQSLLLARELTKLTGIKTIDTLIKRVKKTDAQKELGAAGRYRNLMSAFEYDSKERAPSSVIIADDILTTGSTVNAMTGILRSHGAKHIYVVCIAVS